jgi:phosphoglycolate phosphatase
VTAPAIGFDLDLTLADTRAGIAAAYRALSALTGVAIDVEAVVSRIGPPLEVEIGYWFPAAEVPAVAGRYRTLYSDIAVPLTTAMPGALAALETVRAAGGRTIIVSGKNHVDAERTVLSLGLEVDEVVGGVFGADKGTVLRRFGVHAYVGDHLGDVDAARAADVLAVGVTTGPFDRAALSEYGAGVVLPDLLAFPGWYADFARESLPCSEIPPSAAPGAGPRAAGERNNEDRTS